MYTAHAVETKFGTVHCSVTDNDHIYVEGKELVVNGKLTYATLHLTLRNVVWDHIGQSGMTTLYTGMGGASTSACKKLKEELPQAVSKWIAANPSILNDAHIAEVKDQIERLNNKVNELEEQIAELVKGRTLLQSELNTIEDERLKG
jgi:uncharacterized protein (DUF342 family)